MNSCLYCPLPVSTARAKTCGSAECKRLWNNQRCREYQQAYAAEHGRSHSHRSDVRVIKGSCTGCGKELRHARNAKPVCRDCAPAASRVQARRRRVEAKVARAAAGTAGDATWTTGACNWCGDTFAPSQRPTRFCSAYCKRRSARMRRAGRESIGGGEWRWSDFMRIARKFGYCCAYCGTKPDRLDPDHVVPLARGGENITQNLLPTCMPCNSDKRHLLLHEWAHDRERRELEPRNTSWADDDCRYSHLTVVRMGSVAA